MKSIIQNCIKGYVTSIIGVAYNKLDKRAMKYYEFKRYKKKATKKLRIAIYACLSAIVVSLVVACLTDNTMFFSALALVLSLFGHHLNDRLYKKQKALDKEYFK